MAKAFEVVAKVSGNTHVLTDGYKDGIVTTHYTGNKRSSEKSAINGFKRIMGIYGINVEKIISVTEI